MESTHSDKSAVRMLREWRIVNNNISSCIPSSFYGGCANAGEEEEIGLS